MKSDIASFDGRGTLLPRGKSTHRWREGELSNTHCVLQCVCYVHVCLLVFVCVMCVIDCIYVRVCE